MTVLVTIRGRDLNFLKKMLNHGIRAHTEAIQDPESFQLDKVKLLRVSNLHIKCPVYDFN